VPRLNAYEKQTAPLVQYYRRFGTLHDVNANRKVEEVQREIFQLVSGMPGTRQGGL
jgi:adenylate kinase family enzyme